MIATATNTVITTVNVGRLPFGLAVTPDGSKVYVANNGAGTVSVISTATDTVLGPAITVGSSPVGVGVTLDGSKVYVANEGSNSVSVIATATDTVLGAPIAVGGSPDAVGVFIGPAPPLPPPPAPTLGTWGLFLSALLLGGVGYFVIRNRVA